MDIVEFSFLLGIFCVGVLTLVLVFFRGNAANDFLHPISERVDRLETRIERILREEIGANRNESSEVHRKTFQTTNDFIARFGDSIRRELIRLSEMQRESFEKFSQRLGDLIERNEMKMDEVRKTVEVRLETIQKDNNEKLEKMRETVDEKLHKTLEQRLGDSFRIVGERLELVHKGLGEMQTLAMGVGDLKRVLQNVKARGTWGEVQLGNILDDMLTPDQYAKNVATKKGSRDRVEFAIKLPAKNDSLRTIFLPIDAKFPMEDYQGLTDASEKGDMEAVERFSQALENRMKSEAKDIMTKYLDPPYTTDFGILFLPNNGLYAEALRRPGFAEKLQREYRVIITGPITIAAIINSLQMGFRTLAIEKRSSEVWELLGSVKKQFSLFGDILEKTQKKLHEASKTLDDASQKSRTIERRLDKVQELPLGEQQRRLDTDYMKDDEDKLK